MPTSISSKPTSTPAPMTVSPVTPPQPEITSANEDRLEAPGSSPDLSALALAMRTMMSGSAPVLRAPDGMAISGAAIRRPNPTSATRAEKIATGKVAEVPQRIQIGPTCGLYALGMVMDFWHQKDSANPVALVSDIDLEGRGKQFTIDPTTDERLLDYVRASGYTSAGEMFKARDLAETASHFGYTASIHEDADLETLYRILDQKRPAIVGFDVNWAGNPGDFGGKRAHYAVIQGYFDDDGERYLIARHGWGGRKDYIWKASDFDASWKALKATDYYGKPGDGIIPDEPDLKEPTKLDLPDLGNGQAGIERSLATKIVEVIPRGSTPIGKDIL